MTETYQAKKGNKGKVIVSGVALLGALVGGSMLHVDDKLANAYARTKGAIVDVFTYDLGERANDLAKKMQDEKQASKYSGQIQQALYASIKTFADSQKESTMEKILQDSSKQVQTGVFKYVGKSVDQEVKAQYVMGNLDALTIDQTKVAYKSLDKMIEVDDRKHPNIFEKVKFFFEDTYNKIKGSGADKK